MKESNLNQLEKKILASSDNTQVTKSRMKMVAVSAMLFIAALCFAAFRLKSIKLVVGVCILYVLISLFEKLAYGNAVIGYKTLIQKLQAQIKDLESKIEEKTEKG